MARMGKPQLFKHFVEKCDGVTTNAQARAIFDELLSLAEREMQTNGEFSIPGMVKLVKQNRQARMGRNPATGESIQIPAKTVVKARIAAFLFLVFVG